LVNKELPKILSYFKENLKDHLFSLKLNKKVFFELLEQKKQNYDELKDQIENKNIVVPIVNHLYMSLLLEQKKADSLQSCSPPSKIDFIGVEKCET